LDQARPGAGQISNLKSPQLTKTGSRPRDRDPASQRSAGDSLQSEHRPVPGVVERSLQRSHPGAMAASSRRRAPISAGGPGGGPPGSARGTRDDGWRESSSSETRARSARNRPRRASSSSGPPLWAEHGATSVFSRAPGTARLADLQSSVSDAARPRRTTSDDDRELGHRVLEAPEGRWPGAGARGSSTSLDAPRLDDRQSAESEVPGHAGDRTEVRRVLRPHQHDGGCRQGRTVYVRTGVRPGIRRPLGAL
jgi:hypothetical protein